MTGFSVEKDGSMSGGLEDWATSAGKAFGKAKKLFSVVTTGFEDFQNLDEAIRGSGTSFNDYIKYLSRSEDATEAFGLATLYTRARVLLLNMALSTGLALAASLIVKKISEAAQSIETNTKKQQSVTNLTINATQVVSKEENKVTDATDKKNDVTSNESQTTDNTNNKDKTVKTTATTLTGAGLGAAAGMAIGGPVGALIGTLLGGFAGFFLGRHANGLKSSKTNHFANVDERGSELIVRKPASGRYTYLETGDGVVPADITSRLFEMGGNPDKWFSDQLAKHSSASMVQSRDAGGISLSIGDVNVNNPVGDSDALARELVNRLPNKVVQELNRR